MSESAWSQMSAVKLALLADQMRSQTTDGDALAAEPIAIIGVGCRFPGGVETPDDYWKLIAEGVDAISEVPHDRWDLDEFYDDDGLTPGKMNTRWGGFVDGIDQFDAPYFGISPREASHMDPQQRMFMEVAVEALERAGQPIDGLAGSATGVFVGSSMLDYGSREHAGPHDIDAYSITGNVHCIIPNRFSFTFDLRGPSVSVDTACSSSLVAVHLACQSLRSRDSDLAVAGGVNALLSPEPTVGLAKWSLMAPDGRCKTLDASADGFVRAEGCGVVTLKRLADAVADNDPVLAVIRGSAVNQDGRSTAMTAPNGLAQQDVMRRALATAQVRPEQITMMELHGTGTVLGDPIEVEAIIDVLSADAEAPPIALSAVKTNIGHLEAASGVAGLIKTVLCLQHGFVPPPVHFDELNPHISLDDTRLFVPDGLHPWPRGAVRRIAGVSSFGFGGTNAHVLVEEAPVMPASAAAPESLPLLVLSAQSSDALRETAGAMSAHLATRSDADLPDLLATAGRRRTHHGERLGVVAPSIADAIERLEAFVAGERNTSVVNGRAEPGVRRRVAFVCSGQGNQWWGMARDLLAESSVFRATIERCDELLSHHLDWSLIDELQCAEADSRLERTEIAQPAIFAVQVGLAELLGNWGITPDAVVGHSVGEVAAAHLAGALSLEDAVTVIAHRGAAMADTIGTGAMASVELSADSVRDAVAPFGDRVSIAAINAPNVTVISGEADAIAEAVSTLRAEGAAVRPLEVTYPFHSTQMLHCGATVEAALRSVAPTAPQIRLISTVTGLAVTGADLDAGYWSSNVTEPVRFADAVGVLADAGCDTFIELGPHPVLGGAIARTLDATDHPSDGRVITPTLRTGRAGIETLSVTVGELHCAGVDIDGGAVWPGRRPVVALPTYPWQHRRHWADNWQPASGAPALPAVGAGFATAAAAHPLVGNRLRSAAIAGALFESWPTPDSPSFVGEHRVAGTAIVPGTGFVEMIRAAAELAASEPVRRLDHVDLLAALVLDDDGPSTSVQIHVRDATPTSDVIVSSSTDGEVWTEHARGRAGGDLDVPASVSVDEIRARCQQHVSGEELYASVSERRIQFGPSFHGVNELWLGDGEALARLVTPDDVATSATSYGFHPALLDAASHSLTALLPDDGTTFLPIAIGSLQFHRPPTSEMWSHVRLDAEPDAPTASADVVVVDGDGNVIVEIAAMRVARVDTATVVGDDRSAGLDDPDGLLYELDWRPDETAPSAADPSGAWLIIADASGTGEAVAEALRERNVSCEVIAHDDTLDADTVRARVTSSGATEVVYLRALDTPPLYSGVDSVAAQAHGLGGALTVAQALGDSTARLSLVTRGALPASGAPTAPEQATLHGFGAGLLAERPASRCARIDLDPTADATSDADALLDALGSGAPETIALRNGGRLVPRLVPLPTTSTDARHGATRLASSSYGVLDGLHDTPMRRTAPGPGDVEIAVEVTGLNFRDVLVALDLYPERSEVFGDECVGVISRVGADVTSVAVGDRVVALAPGAFASHVVTRADLVYPVPTTVSAVDAATIPMTFLTAQYALVMLGGMQPGERVLIHAGAGGVGMAAIQIAHAMGVEVFATASEPKQQTLRDLGVEHVFDSRSLDFADQIHAATDGKGVDLVLNSLADEFIARSVDVVAENGRFLEIGRRDVWTHERMEAERPDIAYHIVFLGELSVGDPPAIQEMLADLLPRFEHGELRPLPCSPYDHDDVVDAFRLMAQARHTGKVVIRRPLASGSAEPDGTYLLTGGIGGIGLAIARHLVDEGVRSLALVSRRPADDSTSDVVDELRSGGVDVAVFAADVADPDALAEIVERIDADMAPLRGVVHAAGVTDDAVIDEQTWEHFERTLAPKLAGAANLHRVTADRDLDAFVLMSAASTVLGAPGQINYVAANAFLDALAAAHHSPQRPMLGIGWGAWDRIGMTELVDDAGRQRMERRGIRSLTVTEGVGAFADARRTAAGDRAHVLAAALDHALLDDRRVLDELRTADPTAAAAAEPLLPAWIATLPAMRRTVISAFVAEHARKVLGLSANTSIPMRQPLNEIGLDSLMAVELRNAIGAAIGEAQPATLLFDHPTSEALVEHLLRVVDDSAGRVQGPVDGADTAEVSEHAPANAPAPDLDALADMSDEEVEALLLAELSSSDPDV